MGRQRRRFSRTLSADCVDTGRIRLFDLFHHLFSDLFGRYIAAALHQTLPAPAKRLPSGNSDTCTYQHGGHRVDAVSPSRHHAVTDTISHSIHQVPHGQHLPGVLYPNAEFAIDEIGTVREEEVCADRQVSPSGA